MNIRRGIFAMGLALAVALAGALLRPVQAESFYYRWAYAPTYTCGPYGTGIAITFASQPVEWNLPAGAEYNQVYITNGVESTNGPYPLPGGVGSLVYGPLLMPAPSYPATFAFRIVTIVTGDFVYTSTLSGSCAADGVGTSTISNSGGGGGGGCADGRINAKSCAGPVALYCDGTVLKVYDIDPGTGKGSLAFTIDGNYATMPVNTLLKSAGDVELWHLTTGEFQVNADAGEGKLYAFIFNGCPYDGGGYNANIDPND